MTVTAATRVLVLLGDPVTHSASPAMQNAGFRQVGVDGVYVTLRCGPDDLAGLLRGVARAGGGGNVTLPHKQRAADVLDEPSEAVKRTGACNTFWGDGEGRVHGDNTDVEGFRRALRAFLPGSVAEGRVLLLGAGGAARAVLLALIQEDVAEVALLNRTPERARAAADRVGSQRTRILEAASEAEGMEFDLVVNATRLGLAPDDPSPIDFRSLGEVGAAMDLVYAAEPTTFMSAASREGIRVTDGSEMLLRQGAVAFERWWNVNAPLEAMRRALDAPLGG